MTDQTTGGALSLEDVAKTFGDQRGVRSVSLDIAPGEFVTLLGPSGSGKTTTLNLIAGFLDPDAGSIRIDGEELRGVPPHQRNLGVVFQQYALFPHMSASENIEYPLKLRRIAKERRREMVRDALQKVHLEEYAERKPAQLSGGQQQRVALARSFVFSPRLLLMDEPLGALDKKLREALQQELSELCRTLGITVVFVTHDQEEALALSDRIAIFNDGLIEQIGTAEDLYRRPESIFVADFVGESNLLHGEVSDGGLQWQGRRIAEVASTTTTEATLMVRPEQLRVLSAEGTEAGPTITGRFEDSVYLGMARRCLFRTDDGTTLTARLRPDDALPDLRRGDPVRLGWAPEDAVVIAG